MDTPIRAHRPQGRCPSNRVNPKTTAVRNALTLLPLDECGVPTVNGVGSRVGMMEALKTAMPAPGHPVLLRVPEFTVFLRKA